MSIGQTVIFKVNITRTVQVSNECKPPPPSASSQSLNFCYQTWYIGISSPDEVVCERIGLLSSRLVS